MALTSGELVKKLTDLGYQPWVTPGENGVRLIQPSRHYQDPAGAYQMVLELWLDDSGTFLQVVGPGLGFDGPFAGAAPSALAEVQTAFHLLRFTEGQEGEGVRPQLEYPCIAGEAALSNPGLATLLAWAAQTFDPALGYLACLARTGRREPRFLAGDPPELARLQERAHELRAQVEATEREIDHVRRPRAFSSHVMPQFL